MRAVVLKVGARTLYLLYNGEVMFTVQERFGGVQELLGAMKPDTREGFGVALEAVAMFAEQGELARRNLGYSAGDICTADDLRNLVSPFEIVALKSAVVRAIELGYGREITDESDEIDLGLAELEEKKEPDPRPFCPHGADGGPHTAGDNAECAGRGV